MAYLVKIQKVVNGVVCHIYRSIATTSFPIKRNERKEGATEAQLMELSSLEKREGATALLKPIDAMVIYLREVE